MLGGTETLFGFAGLGLSRVEPVVSPSHPYRWESFGFRFFHHGRLEGRRSPGMRGSRDGEV